ncbi:DUF995 domain-containing protein [Rhizobium sp. P40RR-XXII]|uniref:DUF995 domain-containing protein n=1 Tax=Rhizobium sp. P40RR-XXII TaxID=2726739 RepID=UPI001456B756|nr:DUF995 domain-containing protein [Rhizobium sp. P40RR-XXII]NLS17734.1 DUF995 domain-containing protein [Rhizobium sp. P40RR-XXII]
MVSLYNKPRALIRLGAATLAAVIALGSVASSSAVAASKGLKLPVDARPMTAYELYQLYRDKNWQWPDGAGQMQDANRHFAAWVDGKGGKSWAEGRWSVSDAGRMCFEATWYAANGKFPAKTCFLHRILNETVYQKREPGGAWFIFRHAAAKDADEAQKLVANDLVTERLSIVKATLSTSKAELKKEAVQ